MGGRGRSGRVTRGAGRRGDADRGACARDLQRIRDWVRRAGDEPKEWYDAAAISDTVLLLTAEELVELNEAVLALMKPYRRRERRADPPEGARPVRSSTGGADGIAQGCAGQM